VRAAVLALLALAASPALGAWQPVTVEGGPGSTLSDRRSVPVMSMSPTGSGTNHIGSVRVDNTADQAIPVTGTVVVSSAPELSGTVHEAGMPSASAPTDSQGNIATFTFGGYTFLFNGASWDRARGDITNGLDVDVTRIQAAPVLSGTVHVDNTANEPVRVSGTVHLGSVTPSVTLAVVGPRQVNSGNAGTVDPVIVGGGENSSGGRAHGLVMAVSLLGDNITATNNNSSGLGWPEVGARLYALDPFTAGWSRLRGPSGILWMTSTSVGAGLAPSGKAESFTGTTTGEGRFSPNVIPSSILTAPVSTSVFVGTTAVALWSAVAGTRHVTISNNDAISDVFIGDANVTTTNGTKVVRNGGSITLDDVNGNLVIFGVVSVANSDVRILRW
jgi:hypothetical protein